MQERIITIVEEKLVQALREVDLSAEEKVREAWKEIGPNPRCPTVQSVMKEIHGTVAHGYKERARVAREVMLSTLSPIRSELNKRLVDKIMVVVINAFPDNIFLALVQHTPDVYERHFAPSSKFDQQIYSLEFALVSVSAANMARQGVVAIETALGELLLQEAVARPSFWKRALLAILKYFAYPAVKWIFRIVSAVLVACLIYVLGIN